MRKRILLVRTSAMGDIVHTLPVLAALRRWDPKAQIGWVVESQFAPLLADHAQIDTLFEVRTRAWRQMPKSRALAEAYRAVKTLRTFRPDIALDLMGNHKGAILARLSGAQRIIGFRRSDRREPSSAVWISERVPATGDHAIDRALSLLAPLGARTANVDLGGEHLLPAALGDPKAPPYAVIQAGAGWGNKQYPAAWWGRIAATLAERGLRVHVPIAPGEEDLAETVAASSSGAATPVDARSFTDLVALLRGARVAIGGDTGPIHLAHALGTRVVCLMGPTDPSRHGPYGGEAALWHQLPCSFCYKRISGTRACLLAIPPARVATYAISQADI